MEDMPTGRQTTGRQNFGLGLVLRFGFDSLSGWLVVMNTYLYDFRCHCPVPLALRPADWLPSQWHPSDRQMWCICR